ncbi:Histidine kinase-, DNA gyrase B-, and HSP90-like ATPase [Anaerovirgula multivorans]|uniref:Histidine kinase-, DNA gyrase B-, and HSP90-like ATPase n=1 Tax=Anaerovirgula multivorans TaxID=312168 RepID=A0A239AWT7_9FIRM|nr:histidine kinase [Anaerovirgula multivorans]SNS00020.1 Histidine kinase-, DNA gyrase B-, and HSP90-like ATPase [Anaerovirgula multivorans]
MNRKNLQLFDWGEIEWIYEPESMNSSNVMHIGVATILPRRRQNKHIHYGNEQFLYVLSGEGEHLLEKEVIRIKPGALFHIEAGSVHETMNIGEEPIKQLVISIPAGQENNSFIEARIKKLLNLKNKQKVPIIINDEIKYLYDEAVDMIHIPITILDKKGEAVIVGKDFPYFCIKTCGVNTNIKNCCLYKVQDKWGPRQYKELSANVCAYGITVFYLPILCNDESIGTIIGGHIRTSKDKLPSLHKSHKEDNLQDSSYDAIQVVPKGTMIAILQQMKKLSKNIAYYYIFKEAEMALNKKEEIIQDIIKNELMLEESLKSTEGKILNMQINNHFLFNTLNAIAGMAVKEDAFKTYESIIHLAQMFRYTLKTGNNFVKLKEEIDQLHIFLQLQKLRHGDKLRVDFDISSEVDKVHVPFNCLQPIVENTFIHGFQHKKDEMHIHIIAKGHKDRIWIEIRDNGCGIEDKNIEELNRKLSREDKEKPLSGLVMIYSKLQLLYQENFTFEVQSIYNKGTTVKIVLPTKWV